MGIIKTINLSAVEDVLEEIVRLSFQTKFFQERYEIANNLTKINNTSFSSGNISQYIYNKNKIILESERKKLMTKIDENIKKIQKFNEKLLESIKGYKI